MLSCPDRSGNRNWYEFSLTVEIAERRTTVKCEVDIRGAVCLFFSHMKSSYVFKVTKWSGNGYYGYLGKLLEHYKNESKFGSMGRQGEINQEPAQKKACLEQSASDVLHCLDDITRTHQRSVQDYALWFLKNTRDDDTYSYLITSITCMCILETDFMQGNVSYELVMFK